MEEPLEVQGLLFDALQPEGPADCVQLEPEPVLETRKPMELNDLEAELHRLFRFPSFRPGQREAIEAVLAGRDALLVLPTGGGKSLTYSLPAFLLPGLTIVISPLISLMQDQVTKLRQQGLPAAVLNSQVPYPEQQDVLRALREDRLDLLFVAPERFRNERFLRALDQARVSLFAVDEAHCVSQWGHDFRPDYLRLAEAAERCGRPPVLAVTATATGDVREDIAQQLRLRPDRLTLVRGFDRPNLFLSAEVVEGGRKQKLGALRGLLQRAPDGPGIVYCATRKNCERVAKALRTSPGGRVGVYHAGLAPARRQRVQERFFAGSLDVVVATNAFGLGIDKQDLRFVIHHDLPGSLEAYYQEAGRAGRDGAPAMCGLLFAFQDIHLQRFFIETGHPDRDQLTRIARAAEAVGWDSYAVSRKLNWTLKGRVVDSALRLLERAGGLEGVDFVALRARAEHEEHLLREMVRYAKQGGCRRASILEYFGAPGEAECEACDRCQPQEPLEPVAAPARKRRARAAPSAKGTTKKARGRRQRPRFESKLDGVMEDATLISQLRQLRGKIARHKRVPAYRVFHDKTLLALAAARPATREELLAVFGLGERKVAQYGKQLLAVLEKHA